LPHLITHPYFTETFFFNVSQDNTFSVIGGNIGLNTTTPNANVAVHINATLMLDPTDNPPTCDATLQGSLYADDSVNNICYCNGTGWGFINDSGVACT